MDDNKLICLFRILGDAARIILSFKVLNKVRRLLRKRKPPEDEGN